MAKKIPTSFMDGPFASSQVDFPDAAMFDQANLPESAPGKLKSIE